MNTDQHTSPTESAPAPCSAQIIHRLQHTEPEGWPDREMMEAAWEEEDARKDPAGNPPEGYHYLCIVGLYRDRWFNGVGEQIDVSAGRLIERSEAGDGSCLYFAPNAEMKGQS